MSARSRYRASRIVSGATRWALARDPDRHEAALDPHHVGWIASVWATIKLGIVGILTPIWAPAIMVRAATNNRRAQRLTAEFPQQMRAIAAGRMHPFSGRLADNEGAVRQAKGTMRDEDIALHGDVALVRATNKWVRVTDGNAVFMNRTGVGKQPLGSAVSTTGGDTDGSGGGVIEIYSFFAEKFHNRIVFCASKRP